MKMNNKVMNSEKRVPLSFGEGQGVRLNWGNSIALSFILFALFIGALVTICIKQDINLVAPDYYKQELDYQKQIERIRNVSQLISTPSISVNNQFLEVAFPDFNQVDKGELTLFRPSNPAFDKTFSIKTTQDTIQLFDIRGQEPGVYKASLRWAMNGKEFYMEKIIFI